MKNLHLILTDKLSRLFLNKINNKLLLDGDTYSDLKKILPSSNYQHLYITSNEEIKKGDWHLKNDKMVTKSHIIDDTCKKIILTTDEQLIADGVQSISDEFLQWFVKNPSCEEIEVEEEDYSQKCRECGEIVKRGYSCKKGCFMRSGNFILTDKNIIYKIIIPKEKAKALTKLEIAKNISAIGIDKEKGKFAFDRFIAGAKSNTARDYWYSKFKQQTTLEQIDQTNPITKGSTALVYKQEALDLDNLESKLDNSLSKETTESLTEWLDNKRVDDDDLTDDEWLIKEKHKETLEFGEWLLSNEIDFIDNTSEGNIYEYNGLRLGFTIKDLHEFYLKQNNKL